MEPLLRKPLILNILSSANAFERLKLNGTSSHFVCPFCTPVDILVYLFGLK